MDTPEDQSVPPWTLFFEGSLYKKYVEYMKNHDLSKVSPFIFVISYLNYSLQRR